VPGVLPVHFLNARWKLAGSSNPISAPMTAIWMLVLVTGRGGAIALGHPLGLTRANRTATKAYGLQRAGGLYRMETMYIATGMAQLAFSIGCGGRTGLAKRAKRG